MPPLSVFGIAAIRAAARHFAMNRPTCACRLSWQSFRHRRRSECHVGESLHPRAGRCRGVRRRTGRDSVQVERLAPGVGVDEMRGGLGHASCAAAPTKAVAFATERHELLMPAGSSCPTAVAVEVADPTRRARWCPNAVAAKVADPTRRSRGLFSCIRLSPASALRHRPTPAAFLDACEAGVAHHHDRVPGQSRRRLPSAAS